MGKRVSIFFRGSLAAILLSSILLLPDCQRAVPAHLDQAVMAVKQAHAPDRRLEVFDISLERAGRRLVVTGEVGRPEFKAALLDTLAAAATGLEIIDSVRVLPAPELGSRVYGIVSVSVANMRRVPSASAELINQTLLGTVVRLLKRENDYYFVQNWDRYLGWLSSSFVTEVDSAGAAAWQAGPRVVCRANYGLVRDAPAFSGTILVDLVPGAVLVRLGRTGDWLQVGLPDGRQGFVRAELMRAEDGRLPMTIEQVLATARDYLGVPYLWGGTSTKGFDCSGFTQIVYRMNNYSLPRDASQQVQLGRPVALEDDFAHLLPGDLLFFGPRPERITHVALYLGGKRYIHSAGQVHIASLDPADELYNDYRYTTLRTARRVQPQ